MELRFFFTAKLPNPCSPRYSLPEIEILICLLPILGHLSMTQLQWHVQSLGHRRAIDLEAPCTCLARRFHPSEERIVFEGAFGAAKALICSI
jgi:hypothetical protein